MNKATKAALISAFVFPGFGHLFLKKHISCIVFAGAAFASLYVVISKIMNRALQIAGEIQASGAPLDIAAITERILTQAMIAEPQGPDIASAVLVMSWLIGIVDAYRVGRRQDKGKGPVDHGVGLNKSLKP